MTDLSSELVKKKTEAKDNSYVVKNADNLRKTQKVLLHYNAVTIKQNMTKLDDMSRNKEETTEIKIGETKEIRLNQYPTDFKIAS